MNCSISEETVNYHYTVWYGDRNLGDIFFDTESLTCSVRFYGWGVGIPSSDLMEIGLRIYSLEEEIKKRLT